MRNFNISSSAVKLMLGAMTLTGVLVTAYIQIP